MFSNKQLIILSALVGVVVGVLAETWWDAIIAGLALVLVIVLVDKWTTPDFGLLVDEVDVETDEPAPEPAPPAR